MVAQTHVCRVDRLDVWLCHETPWRAAMKLTCSCVAKLLHAGVAALQQR